MKKVIFVSILVGQCAFLQAQEAFVLKPTSSIMLNVDYSTYRFSETEHYVELTYAIFPSVLTIVRTDSIYMGKMEIFTTLKDKKTDSIVFYYPRIFPIQIPDTTTESINQTYLSKITFRVPHGEYLLTVKYFDGVNRLRHDSVLYECVIKKYPSTPAMSDIDICSHIMESENTESPFYKNSYEAITNPTRTFGPTVSPVLYSYVELYNLTPHTPYYIVTRLVDSRGVVLKEQKRKKIFTSPNIVDVTTMKLFSYPSGKYWYRVELQDSSGEVYTQRQKVVFVHNPDRSGDSLNTIRTKHLEISAQFSAMTEDELDREFAVVRYITRKEDERLFSKLKGSEAKREFLAQLWAEIESGKRGVIDITRSVYMDRVSIANQRYRQFGKEGWRTDRGRVYILYGEPSDVERQPMGDNTKPYEVWQYDHIEGGVKFIFVDRSGYGEYILVHSTKRGEIQNESWEQYLH
ncbi:MAG: GWxTD domain-containing protein [Bacteroidetes bacterium]|nr:GWxTD domain-containing protein [Bacteroidota bacterium]